MPSDRRIAGLRAWVSPSQDIRCLSALMASPTASTITAGMIGNHPMLYIHHPASLEHDPSALSPEHPDNPLRVRRIEIAMASAGWLCCTLMQAPAASPADPEVGH